MKKFFTGFFIVIIFTAGYLFLQFRTFSAVSEGSKISAYKNPQKALLVIDIQKDLTEKDGKAVLNLQQTDQIIENVNTIINKSKKLGIFVIYIKHEYKKSFFIDLITKGALSQGSSGAEIDSRIIIKNDNIFIKNIMDSFSNPKVDNFLQNHKINHLYFTGIDAEACVDKTLKAALNRGYKATVISDGIATKSEKQRLRKLDEFKILGVEIIKTNALLNNL